MVSVMSLLMPIVLSAVFVFVASSILHMFTPWHKGDMRKFSNEDAVANALRPLNLAPGTYGMPKPDSMKDMGSPEFKAKMKNGPVAVITIRKNGEMNMGPSLIQWFVYSMVVSLFAGYIAGVAFGPGTEYLRIFQVVGCVAFVGYAMGGPQESIWWSRPWGNTLRNMLDGLFYGLLTGGTFGWLWPR